MLSGTETDSRKLSCSRATALEQEKTSSQSLCQKAYFPAYDSNSYSLTFEYAVTLCSESWLNWWMSGWGLSCAVTTSICK